MALPSFSYSISRKYPYKWFTIVVILGGICATVFFSIINLAADGYNLSVEYTSNYNETMGVKRWTSRFPFSILDKLVTTCQSEILPVNSLFLSNNSALQYTLTGISKENGTLPALEYTNNFVEDCSFAFIEIDLESTQRTAAQQGWGGWGPKVFAQLSCLINNSKPPTSIDMTVGYEFLTPTIETGTAFSFVQPLSNQTNASLWWGQSLLSSYWLNLATAVENTQDDSPNEFITQGSIIFHSSSITDMTDLDFFGGINYHFTSQADDTGEPNCCINAAFHDYPITIGNLASHNETPNIWIQANNLAKAFYATIMADLGQNSSMNMLANVTALEYFSSNLTNTIAGQDSSVTQAWMNTNPATQPYADVKDFTGPLFISPSVIAAQYLCQIPKLKSGGSLFVTILIADLVFLQALWKILTWITMWRLESTDSRTNYCEGCKAREAGIELLERQSTMSTQYDPGLGGRPHLRAGHISSGSSQQLLSPN